MSTHESPQRTRRTFWVLVLVAVAAAGSVRSALDADPSPLTALRVAFGGLVLIVTIGLAARVMIALERARGGRSRGAPPPPGYIKP